MTLNNSVYPISVPESYGASDSTQFLSCSSNGLAEDSALSSRLDWTARYEKLCSAVEELACKYFGIDRAEGFFRQELLNYLEARAEILGLKAQGSVSRSGSCRMLQCQDGVIALNLARPSDFEMLPAWLGEDIQTDASEDIWCQLGEICLSRKAQTLVDLGAELGLALTLVGESAKVEPLVQKAESSSNPYHFAQTGSLDCKAHTIDNGSFSGSKISVLDLSSLWAGPLVSKVLAEAGAARVEKIESLHRPDGARAEPEFYDYLNGAKSLRALDFKSTEGLEQLKSAIAQADVVIESSRPRALQHLGIFAEEYANEHNLIWISITGYGREINRIAYGDDAAVAAGLYVRPKQAGELPHFAGDATGDPITAMVCLLGLMRCLSEGSSGLLDVGMVPAIKSLGPFE